MAITTTENINVAPPPVCRACGWPGSLMTRNHQGDLVHWDPCPEGPPPPEPYVAIGHDPLGDPSYLPGTRVEVFHADLRALKLLKEHRVGPWRRGLTIEGREELRGIPVGDRIDLEKAEKAMEARRTGPSFPGETAEEDAYLKGQALPLGAGRRKRKGVG